MQRYKKKVYHCKINFIFCSLYAWLCVSGLNYWLKYLVLFVTHSPLLGLSPVRSHIKFRSFFASSGTPLVRK